MPAGRNSKGSTVWDTLTDTQKQEIAGYAKIGCTNEHIAELMEIGKDAFRNSNKLTSFCRQKRAIFRHQIRQDQSKHSKTTPVGAIWLGKNELGQSDKNEIRHAVSEETASLLGLVDGVTRGKLPSESEEDNE